jgi:hypothetical protein
MRRRKEYKALLLYLETCAVDHGGLVDHTRLTAEDFAQIALWVNCDFLRWQSTGGLEFGPLPLDRHPRSYLVELSNDAWEEAHKLRRRHADQTRVDDRPNPPPPAPSP